MKYKNVEKFRVISSQGLAPPPKSEKLALFNQDGTPYSPGGGLLHITETSTKVIVDSLIQIGGDVGEIDLRPDGVMYMGFDDVAHPSAAYKVFQIEKWSGGDIFSITRDGRLYVNGEEIVTGNPFRQLHEDPLDSVITYDGLLIAGGVSAGNFDCNVPGSGLVLRSPDNNTIKILSIDNSGAIILT